MGQHQRQRGGTRARLVDEVNTPSTDQIQVIRPYKGGHELALARWGFVPAGMGAAALKKYAMFNARGETLSESRAFGPAFRTQRCVVPLSAFYEWPTVDGKKRKTRLSRPDGLPLLVAGLWNRCEGKGGTVESCTLVTRPPTSNLLSVHDRMPALLLSKDLETWLHGTPEEAQTAALTSWQIGILSVQAA
ncbi:SOS response-associated peptidase [Deinococcus altitudinis]|uniref:SOS response-associated peptidase n=1 Tax=Deinococcus altitudinis TaxID=468914 RepID=UPI0038911AAD